MKTQIGVDLHQRFCYLTAVSARGKVVRQAQAANQAVALQQWLRAVSQFAAGGGSQRVLAGVSTRGARRWRVF